MKKQLLLAPVLFLASAMASAQNGTRLIGFDAVTSGRGGAVTGFFDNPSLMMNNPAGLSFLKTSQADLSISVMAPTVHFQNDINNTDGKQNYFPLGCLSYAHQSNKKLTYGFGIFTQGGMGADFTMNHALYKDASANYVPQDYHSKFAVMQGGGSLAYKISPKFSIGITADIVYGQVEFAMPMSMPPSMMKGVINPSTGMTFGDLFSAPPESGGLGYSEVVASTNMQKLTAIGFNGKIGLAYKPNDKFSFGINYSLPVSLTYENGKTEMDMTYQMNDAFGKVVSGIMYQNPGLTPGEAQQLAMNMFAQMGIDFTKGAKDSYDSKAKFGLPQSISAGLSFAPSRKWRLGLDAEWINWAKAFDQMDISLTGGTNPNINRMMGTEGNIDMAFPMYWKNTVVIRTGAEYDVSNAVVLRAGYAYGSNPVPSSTIFALFPAIVQHHATLGASVKLSNAFAINAAYEYAFKNSMKADANSLVGDEYNNSTSSLQNSIYHMSLSWRIK